MDYIPPTEFDTKPFQYRVMTVDEARKLMPQSVDILKEFSGCREEVGELRAEVARLREIVEARNASK